MTGYRCRMAVSSSASFHGLIILCQKGVGSISETSISIKSVSVKILPTADQNVMYKLY
jgi:hypothetical protein